MPIDEAHKKRAREELPKSVVKTPIKIVDIKEWSRLRLIEQEEEAKRIKLIEKEKAEIPWWVEDEGDSVKPDLTFEEQQECIEELKDALDLCWAERGSARKDQQFMSGYYDCWPELPLCRWERELEHQGTRRSKCEILSKEQKKDVIASLKGWVVQDDFDTTVSRLPFNIRYNILGTFASMIILKDCLKLFLSNPFWYLDVDDAFPNSEGAEAPFGAQLHTLYKTFLKAEPQLAHHWRAQTTRLANVRYSGYFSKRDPTFGRANKETLRAKAYQFAAARLEDKAFRSLLKDEDEDVLRTSLGELYVAMAEFAKDLATSQPLLEWRLLDEIPTEFTRQSKVMQTAHIHQLGEHDSRLDGHQVIGILRPYFFRTGGWNREGRTPEVRVSRAQVLVEDRVGQYPNEAYSSDEDAFPTRKERKPKKAKTENKVAAAKKKPAPKGKAKKGAK
ncbi:Carboxylesterase type B [Penicillium sp. CMV-2018d]|nr:Carboxylesterase type B [Penicillium sp. CMV-2018d]